LLIKGFSPIFVYQYRLHLSIRDSLVKNNYRDASKIELALRISYNAYKKNIYIYIGLKRITD